MSDFWEREVEEGESMRWVGLLLFFLKEQKVTTVC